MRLAPTVSHYQHRIMRANAPEPVYGKEAIVHCVGFQCLGMYLEDKQWHSAFNNEVLLRIVGWSAIEGGEIHSVSGVTQNPPNP
jgi:hypothetical protein